MIYTLEGKLDGIFKFVTVFKNIGVVGSEVGVGAEDGVKVDVKVG